MAGYRRRSLKHAGAGTLLLLVAGCATAPPTEPVGIDPDPVATCTGLFAHIDRAVAAADTGDARAWRIPDHPWLRADRPLASFSDEVDDPARFAAWLERLNALDRESRHVEMVNLPAADRERLRAHWRDAALAHDLPVDPAAATSACREPLNAAIRADDTARQRLREQVAVPDEYRAWQRIAGIYWLAWRFADPAVRALHQRLDAVHADGHEHAADVRRYRVPDAPFSDGTPDTGEIMADMARDALGIPQPTAAQTAALFTAHAPVWAVATASDADRPGALVLDADGRPVVDPERPAEYRYTSWTRMGDEVLLQLNYLVWFAERPPRYWLDPYAGHLDGVIWRTTLTTDGRVLAHDSIHSCGCYYALLPAAGWRLVEPPRGEEPVFSPRTAPAMAAGEHPVIRLAAGTHYLAGLGTTNDRDNARPLSPLPETALRALPHPGGGHASAYEPDGLIPESRRLERFLFWPFGIPSAGASRQHGTHAIAFVGRRHFDDARLLDDLLEATD